MALDTSSTFIYQPREDLESTKRAVYRDQIHFYNYYTLPAPKGYVSPVILDILCPYDRLPALNNGHFEEAITINLGPDDIYGRWEEDTTKTENYSIIKSNTDKKHWILGDSYFEPSYCKHSYSLAKPNTKAKIISYTAYNELTSLKQNIRSLSTTERQFLMTSNKFSFQYQLVSKYRNASFMSVETLLNLAQITDHQYEQLKRGDLEPDALKRIAKILKIDYRLLLDGATGGDNLGKEYMSVEVSKSLQGKFEGYQVAPTASSERSSDLKGSFISVEGDNGGILQLQHNTHYLVTSGELYFIYWSNNCDQSSTQKLEYFDSLWIPPGLKHCFKGLGSLIALTNGEKFGYLNDFARSNLWDQYEVAQRIVNNEIGWGYDN